MVFPFFFWKGYADLAPAGSELCTFISVFEIHKGHYGKKNTLNNFGVRDAAVIPRLVCSMKLECHFAGTRQGGQEEQATVAKERKMSFL